MGLKGEIGGLLLFLLTMTVPAWAGNLPAESVSIIQNEEWQPIENKKLIEAGSVLDFSFLSDPPAGKYGKLVVRNGRFEFENRPGRRIRFFGANLCYDLCYPAKADAPKLAETLQRMGYNLVRLHHYDVTLCPNPGKPDFDSGRLDRLEYLVHCLKDRGIYVIIDLHSLRAFAATDAPEWGRPFSREIAAVIHVSPTARAAWERFARALLTHRNPYTKLTWAEDPVLMGICPVNEDFIYGTLPPSPLFAKAYDRWRAQKKITPKDENENRVAYNRFQTELQQNTYTYYRNFLDSLGARVPMTGINNVEIRILALLRQRLDFVDNHCYWNHPDCFPDHPWQLPWRQANTVSELSRCSGTHRIYGPTRILGKPFTVTEFNYCYPSPYRSEGGPLMGAYSAFQDWDALLRFDFGHDADALSVERPAYVFGAIYDPINRLTQNIIALLFLRGDVAPAKHYIPYLVTEDTAYRTFTGLASDYFPDSFRQLAVCTGVGSLDATDPRRVEGKYPVAVVPGISREKFSRTRVYSDDSSLVRRLIADRVIDGNRCRESEGRYISDTGQLDLNVAKSTFKAVTPRSEAFILFNPGRLGGDRVSVENSGGVCTILVAAVDNETLRKSRRLLVLHLTDVQNDKIKFSKDMGLWEGVGQLPHLVRRGTARINLRLDTEKKVRVWAVDLSGARKKELAISVSKAGVSFVAETITAGGTFLAYEVEVP